ncbi:MAG: type I restriction endonuclease subunit R [Thermales bacterium]|nr:type I restriction endonuclease subunit R [Thermales bacterium]
MPITANFDETKQSQLPFVELLINLGYEYIPHERITRERGDSNSKFLLKDTAIEYLSRINSFEHNQKTYQFSKQNIVTAVEELENTPLEGLIDTSNSIYQIIRSNSGRTFREYVDGGMKSFDFRFIDYDNINNNHFGVAVEYEAQSKGSIRCDIVLFINGLPLVVIENKKSSVEVIKGVNQLIKYQGSDYCPNLFAFGQLLVASNKSDFLYGTIGTPSKFYTQWREKDISIEDLDQKIQKYIPKKIDESVYETILRDLNGATKNHLQVLDRLVSQQDRGVYNLLRPERLLDIIKNHILYDGGIKKVSRYPQYFAVQKIMDRVENVGENGKRNGGVVWHTQGSGKSLTMVLFVKALIENPNIINPRIIIVTDRKDLDIQIKNTFKSCNLKKDVIKAKTGKNLIDLIKSGSNSIITTLVHKFESSKNYHQGFSDNDPNIFVLIDEAHRTQSGFANIEMNNVLPNACFIGFTGTPLMKNEKKSTDKFGEYIDRYTIDDALSDEVILPLIYQGRTIQMRQESNKIDRDIDRIELSMEQKKNLQKSITSEIIQSNPKRTKEFALDIENHFLSNFADSGLKAQLVAPSKFAAIMFKKYFDEMSKVKTAVIISEAHDNDEEDSHKKEVDAYLKSIKEKYVSLEKYEKDVVESFRDNPDGIKIIIVVDKLLTGFDAPRNTVLYLTKKLKDHNLLQAIARVNRLFDNPTQPKTSGFIIDYSENARNLKDAMDLFSNYDPEDLDKVLFSTDDKVKELQKSYSDLYDLTKGVSNPNDDQEYLEYFSLEDKRKEFYDSINRFAKIFSECLALGDFHDKFDLIDTYKKDLKKMINIRQSIKIRYADDQNFKNYKQSIINILDEYVTAGEVEILTKEINIHDGDTFDSFVDNINSNKSKAEAIAAHVEKSITITREKDPDLFQKISKKVQDIINRMRESKLSDLEALNQLKVVKENLGKDNSEDATSEFSGNKNASLLFRNVDILKSSKIQYSIDISNIISSNKSIDWHKNEEKIRIITNLLDDYIYENTDLNLATEELNKSITQIIDLAKSNSEIW